MNVREPESSLETQALSGDEILPTDDPVLDDPALDLGVLTEHWARYAARRPMTAEQMRGSDRRAQRFACSPRLMEAAGRPSLRRACRPQLDRPAFVPPA